MKNKLISIIIPVYNGEKYLADCIESVINQTYQNLEIIIVNDGSTDATAAICTKYAEINEKIKVLNIINNGVSNARNIGVHAATGEYIGFVDSDDTIDCDMYEKLMLLYEKDAVDLAICGYRYVFDRNKMNETLVNSENSKIFSQKDTYYQILLDNSFKGFAVNKLYKTTILKKMAENDELFDCNIHICEDLLFNCNYLKYCSKTAYFSGRKYKYYMNDSSAYHQKFNDNWLTILSASEKIMNIYKNNCKENYILACSNYIGSNFEILKKLKISKCNDTQIKKMCQKNINTYYLNVLLSSKVPLKNKIKFIIYKVDPCLILKIKKFIKMMRW